MEDAFCKSLVDSLERVQRAAVRLNSFAGGEEFEEDRVAFNACMDLVIKHVDSVRSSKVWMPIEDEPKIGQDVLVFCDDTKEQFVAYSDGGDYYTYAHCKADDGPYVSVSCRPTHFMELPQSPEV